MVCSLCKMPLSKISLEEEKYRRLVVYVWLLPKPCFTFRFHFLHCSPPQSLCYVCCQIAKETSSGWMNAIFMCMLTSHSQLTAFNGWMRFCLYWKAINQPIILLTLAFILPCCLISNAYCVDMITNKWLMSVVMFPIRKTKKISFAQCFECPNNNSSVVAINWFYNCCFKVWLFFCNSSIMWNWPFSQCVCFSGTNSIVSAFDDVEFGWKCKISLLENI